MRNYLVGIAGFLLIVALAAYAIGQEPKARIDLNVRSVNVDAAVADANGKWVTSLTREDFSVFEDGEPRQIQSFEATEIPFHTLLVFDCRSLDAVESGLYRSIGLHQYSSVINESKESKSLNMKIGDRISLGESPSMMISAAARFVEKLQPNIHLAVAVTDDRGIRLLHDWDRGDAEIELRAVCDKRTFGLLLPSTVSVSGEPKKQKVMNNSERLLPNGTKQRNQELHGQDMVCEDLLNTPLVTRTVDPVEAKLQGTGGRKAVVWFGPVFDHSGTCLDFSLMTRNWKVDEDFQNALSMVSSRSAAYYPVSVHLNRQNYALDGEFTAVNNEEQRIKRLEKIAEASGGRVYYGEKPEAVDSLAEQFNREIGATYTLSFVTPNTTPTDRYHKIEVKVRNSKLKVLQSRTGYLPSQN